jgi:hypothetical protein
MLASLFTKVKNKANAYTLYRAKSSDFVGFCLKLLVARSLVAAP